MPTRNMIEANKSVFGNLDDFCAIRSDPIRNAGKPRWIATSSNDKEFLKSARTLAHLSLSPNIRLAHYRFNDLSYVVVSGLEISDPPRGFVQEELGGGALTLFLAEEFPSPSGTTAQIRDVVEADDLAINPNFGGFEALQIASLFPAVQVFSTAQLEPEESYKAFFLLALCSRPVLHLRDEQFVNTIRGLAELSSQAIPYETLCRSVLDSDPSSIFLALYRCLEALYMHSHSQRLKTRLSLNLPWVELARTLEEILDWRPREEPSLAAILAYAKVENLVRTAESFNERIPEDASPNGFVAKRIYVLRNSAVHYRPFQQSAAKEDVDWGRISESLAIVIFDIYDQISLGTDTATVSPQAKPKGTVAAKGEVKWPVGRSYDIYSEPDSSNPKRTRSGGAWTTILVAAGLVLSGMVGFMYSSATKKD
jgi:hypothetical protein